MLKKSLVVLSTAAYFFAQAQDVSVVKNTYEVYSNNALNGSAKFNSMAGSMGALGGEASTLMTNPAGIGLAISSNLSGTLAVTSNKNTTNLAGASATYDNSLFDIGNISGIASFQLLTETPWKFVNIAANYSNQTIDDYVFTPGNSNLVYDIPALSESLTYKGHAYDRYGNISKMNIGVSGNYDNRIYVGGGLNFHGAQIEQWDTAAFSSALSNTVDSYYKQYTPYTETSSGFSASVGVIGKFSQQFRMGASLETPTWWTIQRTYNYYADPDDGTAAEDRRLSTPMKATISAAYVPSKSFAMNLDYTIGVTKPRYKEFGPAEVELNTFFNDNNKSAQDLRLGAEYRSKKWRFRGGYGMATNPVDDSIVSTFSVDGSSDDHSYNDLLLGKRNTLALGLGYDFKSFYIDFGYQNISSEYSNPFLFGSADFNSGYFSNNYIIESDSYLVSKVKNVKNNFALTFGWKF